MIKLFTMGFTKKTAEQFFTLLKMNGVKKLIDIRLNNHSQLAGFTKGVDLKYFLKEIADIEYEHNVDFAPTKDLLKRYQSKKINWEQYETEFSQNLQQIMKGRNLEPLAFDLSCILCSEATPDHCHRRLVAEYLVKTLHDVRLIHL